MLGLPFTSLFNRLTYDLFYFFSWIGLIEINIPVVDVDSYHTLAQSRVTTVLNDSRKCEERLPSDLVIFHHRIRRV